MQKRRSKYLLIPAILCLLSGCSQPGSSEEFRKASRASDGVYAFDVDLSDSLCTYDISFYTRVDAFPLRRGAQPGPIRLEVEWVSPSGELSGETVYMRNFGSRGGEQSYRRNVSAPERGVWRLRLKPDTEGLRGFRGMGIVCKRNGTR